MTKKLKMLKLLFATSVSLSAMHMSANAAQIYGVYNGSQNGVTVRDANTLVQTNAFSLSFAVDNIAAGNNDELYLTSANGIYRYDLSGNQLASMLFPVAAIDYQGTSMAIGGDSLYTVYNGSQNGVTIRDANTLAQTNYIDLTFAVDNITAGAGDTFYLTSGNTIYHYDILGNQLNSFSFSDPAISYEGIAFAADVPEPSSLALLGISLVGIGLSRRRKA